MASYGTLSVSYDDTGYQVASTGAKWHQFGAIQHFILQVATSAWHPGKDMSKCVCVCVRACVCVCVFIRKTYCNNIDLVI